MSKPKKYFYQRVSGILESQTTYHDMPQVADDIRRYLKQIVACPIPSWPRGTFLHEKGRVMAHSNMLHRGTRGPESTGHSLQRWLKNPRMICASQSRSNPGKPRSRSPKNRSVIGTKRKIQHRLNPRI